METTIKSEKGNTRFSELLDDYEFIRPRRGQIVHGEVIALTKDSVILDVGAKRDAIVPPRELARLEETTVDNLELGDKLPVYITSTSGYEDELLVSIERGMELQDLERAEELLENGEVLHLKVVGYNRGGLLVEFNRLRGFVPNSLVPGLPRGGNLDDLQTAKSTMIADVLPVKVIKVDKEKKRLVLSGKAAESERRKKRLEELQVGDIITGTVANVVDFGVFVDLDGVDGLIHKSRLSWDHVTHPREILKIGDEVKVMVKEVDIERERVSLDRRALLPDPWKKFAQQFHVGDIMEGIVDGVREFGAFVKLNDHITGLVHVSELYEGISHTPTQVLQPGDKVLVRIIEMDIEKRRVGLSMRRVPSDDIAHWIIGNEEDSTPVAESSPVELSVE